MNQPQHTARPERGLPWRLIGWSAAVALFLLPLVAMQFTDEVQWTLSDFVFAGLLIGGIGAAFELAVRAAPNLAYKLGFTVTLAGTFLMIWINAAVGIIGSSDNDANALYYPLLGIGMLFGLAGKFSAWAMARAAAATGLAQCLLTGVALVVGLGQPENSSLHVVAINGFFISFWLTAAVLFYQSATAAQSDSRGTLLPRERNAPVSDFRLVQRVIAATIVVIGLILLVFKIWADSEPGALPLLMILGGSITYLLARRRRTSQDD